MLDLLFKTNKRITNIFVIWQGLSIWSNWYTHIKMVLFSSLIWSNYTVVLLWKFMVLITLISLQLLAELKIFIFPISNMYGISPGFWGVCDAHLFSFLWCVFCFVFVFVFLWAQCCQCLWIVRYWMPLRFFLMFI